MIETIIIVFKCLQSQPITMNMYHIYIYIIMYSMHIGYIMMTSLRNHWNQIQSGFTTPAGPLHHPEVDRQQVAFNIFPFHIGFFAVSIVSLLHDYFYIYAESKPRFSEHITASNRQPEVCLRHFHEGMGVQPAASKHKRKKTRIQQKRVTYDQCVIYQYYHVLSNIYIYSYIYI